MGLAKHIDGEQSAVLIFNYRSRSFSNILCPCIV